MHCWQVLAFILIWLFTKHTCGLQKRSGYSENLEEIYIRLNDDATVNDINKSPIWKEERRQIKNVPSIFNILRSPYVHLFHLTGVFAGWVYKLQFSPVCQESTFLCYQFMPVSVKLTSYTIKLTTMCKHWNYSQPWLSILSFFGFTNALNSHLTIKNVPVLNLVLLSFQLIAILGLLHQKFNKLLWGWSTHCFQCQSVKLVGRVFFCNFCHDN